MDENKIVKLFNYADEKKEKPKNQEASPFSFQTNPIIQRMLLYSLQNKKSKFNFKDLFK